MFEYWFLGTEVPHHGTTHDFLEVLCQIAEHFSPITAGDFASALLASKSNELAFLRVIDWKFEFATKPFEDAPEQTIKLHKHR